MTTKTLPNSTTTTYYYNGSGVTLVNTGVQGAPGASGMNFGFVVAGNNDTLVNNGTVFGQRIGVYITGSGDSVINAAGKKITATEPDQAGVNFYNFSGTITNFGTISGYANSVNGGPAGNAVELEHGGLVTNFGTLLNGGVLVGGSAGTVVNSGVILGNAAYGGVYMRFGGQVTNLAGGVISANGATVSYEGAPPYGVFIHGGAGTVTNAGTINGNTGNAIELATGFQNRVIVDPGAVFVGTVTGGTAVDATLELASSTSQGTLSGVGTQFVNFGTMAFDPSASWLVKANTAIASAVVTGFAANDTIDLAGFVAVSDTFASNTLVLTNATNAHISLHVQGTFTTANFSIASDGGGGTDLGYTTIAPAALLYGQTIDEAGIVATSETVSAGTMTLFNGASPVGTVAVGTSLASGNFILRSDGSGGTDVIVDTVFGTYSSGVTLLTKPTTIAGTGKISGGVAGATGVFGPSGTTWTVTNQGLVGEAGAGSYGISFASAGTIINAGSITGAQTGIVLSAGGSVTNQSGGTITGYYGIQAGNGVTTVVNAGLITGNDSSGSAAGVQLSVGGSVTNQSTGTISAYNAVEISGAAGTVVNLGLIKAKYDTDGKNGVYLQDGGTVINGASGGTASTATILGYQGAVRFGASGADALINYGTVSGAPGQTGVVMTTGTLINGASGATGALIEGGLQSNAVLIAGAGTVVNYGTIDGPAANGEPHVSYGVSLGGSGTVASIISNLGSNALIEGYVAVYAGQNATVTNAGTMEATQRYGGTPPIEAVIFGGGTNRLIVDPGAIFIGGVNGSGAFTVAPGGQTTVLGTTNGAGTTTLELASASSAGTLSGLGTTITNFASLIFDTGAQWTVTGNDSTSGLGTLGIAGFTFGDTIDLTGFVATSRTFASNTLVLTNAGGVHQTLAMQGTFSTGNVRIAADGSGGTDISLQLDLAYGQTIDQAGIVATTETVSAGVMTLKNGVSTVGTIAVGGTLNSSDFTLRSDGAGGTDVIVSTVFGTYTSGVTLLTNPTTIAATASVTGSVASGIAVTGPSGTAWTLINQGLVSETGTSSDGISFASAGTITNTAGGVVTGSSVAIQLNAGGSVTNQSGGTISGINGIYARTGAATVVNTGSISGNVTSGSGVFLDTGGTVTNLSGGTISGSYGVNADGAATVVNAGSIGDGTLLPTGAAIALKQGGLLTNQTGGDIIAGLQGVYVGGAAGTIVNAGSIGGGPANGNGVIFATGGAVTNQSGGTITGKYGVRAVASAVTVANSGSIGGNLTTGGGVNLAVGGAVTNQSGGTIAGLKGVSVTGGTVTNAGSIGGNTAIATGAGVQLASGASLTNQSGGTITGFAGVYGKTSPATVVNTGNIGGGTASGRGVFLAAGGSVTNQSAGVITGFDGILVAGGATVVNAGSIGGTTAVAFGSGFANRLVIDPGAIFTGTVNGGNTIGATVSSTLELASSASAGILGGLGAQFVNFANATIDTNAIWTFSGANTLAPGATLTNAGTLTDTGTLANYGTLTGDRLQLNGGSLINQIGGVLTATSAYGVTAGGSDTVVNHGIIFNNTAAAINLQASGIVTNAAGGVIEGSVGVLLATGGTVTNAGTIESSQGASGVAVNFTGGNARLIDDPGAILIGTVSATGSAVLELASAASTGVLTGLGTSITNFTSLVFDSGAQWTVAGTDTAAGLGTLGIAGFAQGDTIDLTGFVAVSRTFASNTLVLTNGGGAHQTLHIQGAFASNNFLIEGDGSGGTDIGFVTPPTVTASGTVTFTGGGSPVTLDSGLTITDAGSLTLAGATVAIGSGFVAGDVLNFSSQNGVTASFDAVDGILTLGGTATLIDYQTALESITYSVNPANVDPTNGGGDTSRTIDWTVTDGIAISTTGTSALTEVHVAPTIAAGGSVTYAAGGTAAILDPTVTVADLDSGGLLNSGTVAITGGKFIGDGDVLTASTAGTSIFLSYNATSEILTLSGADTLADYQAVLRSVSFSSTTLDPTNAGANPARTITWSIGDAAALSGATTSTLDVTRLPPVISGTVPGQTTSDEAALDPFAAVSITDPNPGQTETLTITLSNAANGTLSNLDGGTFNSGTYVVTGSTLAVTSAIDGLVFTPTEHQVAPGGTVTTTFTLHVTDTNGTTASDGTTTVIATAVNDPPVIAGTVANLTTTDEATLSPFTGVSISDGDFGQTETVTVTLSNHANGALSNLNGGSYNSVTGVYRVTGSNAAVTTAVDGLVFTPTAHQVVPGGSVATTLTIQATDTAGGTAIAGTSTITATAVNDSPFIGGAVAGQTTTDEVSVSLFATVSLGDVDFGQTETITVTLSNPLNGTLSNLGGGSYNSGTGTYRVTGANATVTTAVNGLIFTPTPHQVAPGSSVATTFTTAVTDTAGATASDSTTTVIATAVNDPPVIAGALAGQTTTDETAVSPFSAVSIGDIDFNQTETVTVTLSNPANGALSNLDGGSYDTITGVYRVTGTDAVVTTAVDGLSFTPTEHQIAPGGTVTTTLTIAAIDTAGGSASDTTTVHATAVNDPPVITGTVAGQTTTDEAALSPFAGVSISDVDFGQTETVTVTLSNAANGVLSDLDGGSYNSITGVYTVIGTDAAVTTAVDDLLFTPTSHQIAPTGSQLVTTGEFTFTPTTHQSAPTGSVTTTFTITATDSAGGTSSNDATVVGATATIDSPVISGTAAGQATTDEMPIQPFSSVVIVEPDAGQIETVTIVLSAAANGTLSNLGGGSYTAATGVYTDSGTAASVTAVLQGLVFTPTAHQVPPGQTVTTEFTIDDIDTAEATAINGSTTVDATAVDSLPVVVNNQNGTSYQYTYYPNDTTKQVVTEFSGPNNTGTVISQIEDSTAGPSVVYAYNPTGSVSETISDYPGPDATGTKTSDLVNNTDGTSLLYDYNPSSTETAVITTYTAANATGSELSQIVDSTTGTSTLYAYNPTSTVSETVSDYSGTNATGAEISDIVNLNDGTSLLYAYNPSSGETESVTHYSVHNAVGTEIANVVNKTDGSSLVYAYNPTSTVTETVTDYSGPNASGAAISDIVNNTDGSSLLYAYNPTSTVTETATAYAGPNATGAERSDIVDNADGTSQLYAYNPTSTVAETISTYSGPDASGTLIGGTTINAPSAVTISGYGQLVDPGQGNHTLQFIAGGTADAAMLHLGASDVISGFNPSAGDTLDLSTLLGEAQLTIGGDIAQLAGYISVANVNGSAAIYFDPTGHGGGTQVALLVKGGALVAQLQTFRSFDL